MKKILTTLVLGGLLAAANVQAVDIYITGSTAFRANVFRAITNIYGANLTSQNPAGDASGKNQVTWSGTAPALFGASPVNIYASYNGSIAGVQALVQNQTLQFLSSSTAGDTNLVGHQADVALSDVYQISTPYTSSTLSDTNVAIQPFAYVKSVTTPASVTNITIQQLKAFLPNGFLPLSYFTGNSSDDAATMFLVGRNADSGTRLTSHADALFTGSPLLFEPNASCVWGVSPGFSSGGGVAGVLNGTCGPAIGYLGLADAKTVAAGANILTYNGVLPWKGALTATPDFTPVIKGQYSYWSYEHLFIRSGLSGNIPTFRDRLAGEIDNDIATIQPVVAVRLSQMKVTRANDGGPITP